MLPCGHPRRSLADFDEGASGIRLESNWVHSAYNAHFMQHYGVNNTVENNIFAKSIGGCVTYPTTPGPNPNTTFNCVGYLWDPAYRGQDCAYRFARNIVAMSGSQGHVHAGAEGRCNRTFELNLYHNASGPVTATFPGDLVECFPGLPCGLNFQAVNASFAEWQKQGNRLTSRRKGEDTRSIIADPQFVSADPAGENDFRVAADSPAVKELGFVPFDLRGMVGPNWR